MQLTQGKLPIKLLSKLLNKYCIIDNSVLLGAGIGEDAAVIKISNEFIALKTDPITFVEKDLGYYLININLNDLSTLGAEGKWFLATLLFPIGTTEQYINGVFKQINNSCKKFKIAYCGGHTEITSSVNQPIAIGFMIGKLKYKRLIKTSGAKIGDNIILTKGIPIETISILARDKKDILKKYYSDKFIKKCSNFIYKPGISVRKEALISAKYEGVHCIHDLTEGGFSTGIYEITNASQVGALIYKEKINIYDEGKELCKFFNINPLGTISSGSLLITVSKKDTKKLQNELLSNKISNTIVGEIVPQNEGIKIIDEKGTRDLIKFNVDEITKLC